MILERGRGGGGINRNLKKMLLENNFRVVKMVYEAIGNKIEHRLIDKCTYLCVSIPSAKCIITY